MLTKTLNSDSAENEDINTSVQNNANLSADIQAVRQMNTVLAIETDVNTFEKAISALEASGFNVGQISTL